MTVEEIKKDIRTKMEKTLQNLFHEFSGLRTGRASTSLLDGLKVEAYGQQMKLTEVATLAISDHHTITVSVWDAGNTAAVEKALRASSLGINPAAEGNLIRIHLPDLTEDRRNEMKKVVRGKAEETKITVRNLRREANDQIKKMEKEKSIGEDESARGISGIQQLTDEYIKKADTAAANKEKEITSL
ncbi:MAG: ribosome recycling factor [Spirochaetes bacterium GWF1_41_5]|nr:MAG: ribosome recycling factor [Spirochaetes bacterium GWF1_41_5]HBE04544.1 ribosome recycling factor [Spirochaetia bacterium]